MFAWDDVTLGGPTSRPARSNAPHNLKFRNGRNLIRTDNAPPEHAQLWQKSCNHSLARRGVLEVIDGNGCRLPLILDCVRPAQDDITLGFYLILYALFCLLSKILQNGLALGFTISPQDSRSGTSFTGSRADPAILD